MINVIIDTPELIDQDLEYFKPDRVDAEEDIFSVYKSVAMND